MWQIGVKRNLSALGVGHRFFTQFLLLVALFQDGEGKVEGSEKVGGRPGEPRTASKAAG
jgi:hypothetical protein